MVYMAILFNADQNSYHMTPVTNQPGRRVNYCSFVFESVASWHTKSQVAASG